MKETLRLRDDAARDMIRTHLDESLLVEAAAGTGKTTLLIQRILNLIVKKEIPVTRIVAITFTEKAAGELKQRLRVALEEQVQSEPAGEYASRYREALSELDLMPVNTIHGFCRDLIRQLPIEAEVDPDLQVLDEAGEAALKDEFWEEWLTERLSSECEPLRPLFDLDLPLTAENKKLSLRDLFDELVENLDTLERLHVSGIEKSVLAGKIEQFGELIQSGKSLLHSCRTADDKLSLTAHSLDSWGMVNTDGGWVSVMQWLKDQKIVKTSRLGNKTNWESSVDLEEARNWLSRVMERIEMLRGELMSFYAVPLIEWLKGAVALYVERKRIRGAASFQDLLVVARNMLHSSETARRYFKGSYDYLLIDEFQDTDPLQTEIIFYLAEEKGEYASDWEAAKMQPGKLFIVGDPKQSIYRFRRADLDLYQRVKAKFRQEGKTININVSFRSVQPIIEEVNTIFAPQMTGSTEEYFEPEYVPMVPHRSAPENEKAVELLPPPENWNHADHTSEETAQIEAAIIAEHLLRIVNSGMQIEDGDKRRSVQWSDIAILTRVWSNTSLLERELRARDIPYLLPADRVFGERAEISAVKSMLCALDNPFDELNTVGVLRSSLLSCTDDELLLHKSKGGKFNYQEDTTAQGHLNLCFDILRDLHTKKLSLTPTELIDEIISATHYTALLALKPHGAYRITALSKLSSYIRSLEGSGKRSISQIVRLLNQETFLKTIGETEINDAAVNQVNILTFFKAKGLEFPVVVLYDLAHRGRESYSVLYNRDRGELEFSMSKELQTSGFAAAKELEKKRQQSEELRLLYVAMTRARDKLILPLYWLSRMKSKPANQQSFLEPHYPLQSCDRPGLSNDLSLVVDTSSYDLKKQPHEKLTLDLTKPFPDDTIEKSQQKFASWQEQHDAAINRLNRSENFGTASGQKAEARKSFHSSEMSRGAAFGSFVHEVLERIVDAESLNLESLVKDRSAKRGIKEEDAQQAYSLIHNMLSSPRFRQPIENSDKRFRELPFSVMLDGVLYEGKMDLVYYENGQPVILDYKTDHGEPQELIGKYKSQASIYARALEQITGQKVKGVILYHVRRNEPVTLSRDELLI